MSSNDVTKQTEGLVTVSQIAELAGARNTQTVSNWRRRYADSFPSPVERGPTGDLFRYDEVAAWLEEYRGLSVQVLGASWTLAVHLRGQLGTDESLEIALALIALAALELHDVADTGTLEARELGAELAGRADRVEEGRPELRGVFSPLYQRDPEQVGQVAQAMFSIAGSVAPQGPPRLDRTLTAGLFEGLLAARTEGRFGHAAEMRTSSALAELMVAVTDAASASSVFDPVAGEAGFLVAAAEAAIETGAPPPALVGQEVSESTWRIANQRLIAHQLNGQVHRGDSITEPQALGRHDAVLADPPFGYQLSSHQRQLAQDRWPALEVGKRPELVWIQLSLEHTAPRGRAALLIAPGFAFHAGRERDERMRLLADGRLEAVVALPSRVSLSSSVSPMLLVLRGDAVAGDRERVLLIDATQDEARVRRGEIESELVERIGDAMVGWRREPDAFRPEPGFAVPVAIAELMETDANLLPSRWVRSPEIVDPEVTESTVHTAARLHAEARDALAEVSDFDLSLRLRHEAPEHRKLPDVAEIISGVKVEAFSDDGLRVLGRWDFSGKGPRYANPATLPRRVTLTRPGDVIILPESERPKAFVDEEGGHVIAAPLQALRLQLEEFHPKLVAALLASREAGRMATGATVRRVKLRDLDLPVVDVETARVFGDLLELLETEEQRAKDLAVASSALREAIVSALWVGVVDREPSVVAIGDVMARLSENDRAVLDLSLEGVGIEEIADRLGLARSTVDQALRRARRAVRVAMESTKAG